MIQSRQAKRFMGRRNTENGSRERKKNEERRPRNTEAVQACVVKGWAQGWLFCVVDEGEFAETSCWLTVWFGGAVVDSAKNVV